MLKRAFKESAIALFNALTVQTYWAWLSLDMLKAG